jgi:hypothetical protein
MRAARWEAARRGRQCRERGGEAARWSGGPARRCRGGEEQRRRDGGVGSWQGHEAGKRRELVGGGEER